MGQIQTSHTGGQPYSDTSPCEVSECSLTSVTKNKLPKVYKNCPKMISLDKFNILTPLQKLPKNVEDLGKIIVAKGFEKLLKVQ